MRTRTRGALVALGLAFVSAAAVALIVLMLGGSSSDESLIPGVTDEELELMHASVAPAEGATPEVSPEDAIRAANINGDPLSATLIRLWGPHGTLAWAINVDTEQNYGYGNVSMGLPPAGRTWPATRITVALTFVDAMTGELLQQVSLADWLRPTPEWLSEYTDE